MTNLIEQLNELVDQLSINNSAENAKTEIDSLNKVSKQASNIASPLTRLCRVHAALSIIDIDLAQPPIFDEEIYEQLKTSTATIESLLQLWEQNGDLSQGEQLDNALSSCKVTITKVTEIEEQVWHKWSESLKQRALLAESLLESQRNLSAVKEVVKNFRSFSEQLLNLLSSMPDDEALVIKCQELAKQMEELKGQMEFDIPKDVEHFLNEFSFNGQPSLKSLTPDVLEWLNEKNMLGNFILRQVH
ncbi:hypothetical protein K0H59_14930 [Shewanella sp. FJAT-51649]|uniref:protein DpdI n=1 Tax=Shewanella sp. FJAT-51649 TaxID=2864210 RepID=UPI001C6560D8|nr:protein DpdI [Shewanella sp. FJAT-51649]QYJ70315.1 hypothetical protein K0H59_14930 [Shewanella sp. FJAT-51649]